MAYPIPAKDATVRYVSGFGLGWNPNLDIWQNKRNQAITISMIIIVLKIILKRFIIMKIILFY